MTFNIDNLIHGGELAAFIFWVGVYYSDVRWLKGEVKHLRDMFENEFLERKKRP